MAAAASQPLLSPPARLLPAAADGYALLAGGTIVARPAAEAVGNAGAVKSIGALVQVSGTARTGLAAQKVVDQLTQTSTPLVSGSKMVISPTNFPAIPCI
ncbi:hypothetical protein B0919_03430 [Hymenobacter sp. CRA2]|nr:hypothetical protein B0919_03430 [Hymenobacter sp. CRA2]